MPTVMLQRCFQRAQSCSISGPCHPFHSDRAHTRTMVCRGVTVCGKEIGKSFPLSATLFKVSLLLSYPIASELTYGPRSARECWCECNCWHGTELTRTTTTILQPRSHQVQSCSMLAYSCPIPLRESSPAHNGRQG